MGRPHLSSLLEDPQFVAELEKLDRLPPLDASWDARAWTHPTFDDVEAVAPLADSGEPWDSAQSEPPDREKLARAVRTLLAVGGFVMMMAVGALAAAVVFHDRVAQILQMLR